jgi:Fur family ferric uptake transcriptional regulator
MDVDSVVGAQPCLNPAQDTGFAVDEAEVVFWGLCPSCAAAGDSVDETHDDEEERQ